jgi:protein ImuA
MQAMSDRVAALRRLVAELERGGENHALTPEDFVRVGLESPADEGAAEADVSVDEAAGSTDVAMRASSSSASRTAWIGRDAAGHGFARRGRPLPTRDDDDRQDCATWARSAVSERRDGSGRGAWPILESDDASLRTAAGVDGHGADAVANEEGYPAEAAGGRFRLSPARFSIAARGEDDGTAVAEPASAMRRAGLPAAASKFGQRAARLSDAQTAAGARVAALAVSPSGEADRRAAPRLALGVAAVDAVLGGGLDRAGLHEIHAAGIGDEAAAAGFVVALCALALTDPAVAPPPATAGVVALPAAAPGRAAPAMTDAPRNPAPAGEGDASTLSGGARAGAVVWIETQFSEAEDGLLWPAGLEDVGLDPRRLVRVKVGRVLEALAAAEEALASPALAAIVLEIRGAAPALDLVALRRLTLAARRHGRPCLLLRTGARPVPTPALTRWAIAARPAVAPLATGWGRRQMGSPAIHAALTRQRAGRDGAWTLEWCADVACFRQPVPQPSVSVPGDRPAEPIRRHAG